MEKRPTISVLLPTYRDGWRLGVQMDAILTQLGEDDEIILLLDGSDMRTCSVASDYFDPRIKRHLNDKPSGVCAAYNQCASLATKDWLLGASGNDELQPGAIDAWRDAAECWPDARIMHGQLTPEYRTGWTHETSLITPAMMPPIWRAKGWYSHGASTFIRRDAWGSGYVLEHEWMADSVLGLFLGWRYGVVDLHAYISRISNLPDSFCAAHNDDEKFNRVVRAIKRSWAGSEYDDIRAIGDEFFRTTDTIEERPCAHDLLRILGNCAFGESDNDTSLCIPSRTEALTWAMGVSFLDGERLESLAERAESVEYIEGAIVECGCGYGGSAGVLANVIAWSGKPERQLIICDTFEGLPPLDPVVDTATGWTEAGYKGVVGSAKGTEEEIKAACSNMGMSLAPLTVKGLFEETLVGWTHGPIAMLHADADWYSSTMAILRNLWEHVVPGGAIIFDDYHYWHGCKVAVDEFFAGRPDAPTWETVSCSVWGRKPIVKAERLAKILGEKRMDIGPDTPVGQLHGLADLISWVKSRPFPVRQVVEVGAYAGASGELFALNFPAVTSVDKWEGWAARAERQFSARIENYPGWQALKMASSDAAACHPDQSIDLVYIDGDHDYANVKSDILAWRNKIRPGGYIAGHDFGHDMPGVAQAVRELLGEPMATFRDFSWICQC